MTPTIIGILGTENRNGVTAQMLDAVLDGARQCGCRIDTIDLNDYRLSMNPEDSEARDAMAQLDAQLKQADGLVLASPTYWGDVSGLMKHFLDCFRPQLVRFTKKGEPIPGDYRGKSYVLLTSCYTSKNVNRFSGITDQTFLTMDRPLQAAGMHRLAEAVCTDTFGVTTLPEAKQAACRAIGQDMPLRIQKGGFTLKRYIQLFFMLAFTILIVMGIQQGLAAMHLIQLHRFWINYLSFVILSYLFLSLMLRYFAVRKHRRT